MWATLAFERSASSRRSAEALDETAGWSAAGRSRRVGGGRAVPPLPQPAQQPGDSRPRKPVRCAAIAMAGTVGRNRSPDAC